MALPIIQKKEDSQTAEKDFMRSQTEMAQASGLAQTMGMVQTLPMQSVELHKHRSTPPKVVDEILHPTSNYSFISRDEMPTVRDARRIADYCQSHGLMILARRAMLVYYGILGDYRSLDGNETKFGNRVGVDLSRSTTPTEVGKK